MHHEGTKFHYLNYASEAATNLLLIIATYKVVRLLNP